MAQILLELDISAEPLLAAAGASDTLRDSLGAAETQGRSLSDALSGLGAGSGLSDVASQAAGASGALGNYAPAAQAAQAATGALSGSSAELISRLQAQVAALQQTVAAQQGHSNTLREHRERTSESASATQVLSGVLQQQGVPLREVSEHWHNLGGGLHDVTDQAASTSRGLQLLSAGLAGLTAIGVGEAVKGYGELVEQVDSVADATGMSYRVIQGFQVGLQGVGASAEESIRPLTVFARNVGGLQEQLEAGVNPTGRFADALRTMHVSLTAFSALSPDEKFRTLLDSLKGVDDQGTRTRLVFDTLGRGGTALFDVIDQGSGVIDRGAATVDHYRSGLSDTAEQGVHKLSAAHTELNQAVSSFEQQIAGAALPLLTTFTHNLAETLHAVDSLPDPIKEGGVVLVGLGTGALAAATAIGTIAPAAQRGIEMLTGLIGIREAEAAAAVAEAEADTAASFAISSMVPGLNVLAIAAAVAAGAYLLFHHESDNAGKSQTDLKEKIDAVTKAFEEQSRAHISGGSSTADEIQRLGAAYQATLGELYGYQDAETKVRDQEDALTVARIRGKQGLADYNAEFGTHLQSSKDLGAESGRLQKEQEGLNQKIDDAQSRVQGYAADIRNLEQAQGAEADNTALASTKEREHADTIRAFAPLFEQARQAFRGAADDWERFIGNVNLGDSENALKTLASDAKKAEDALRLGGSGSQEYANYQRQMADAIAHANDSIAEQRDRHNQLADTAKSSDPVIAHYAQTQMEADRAVQVLGADTARTTLQLVEAAARLSQLATAGPVGGGIGLQQHLDEVKFLDDRQRAAGQSAEAAGIFERQLADSIAHAGDTAEQAQARYQGLQTIIENSTGPVREYAQGQQDTDTAVRTLGPNLAEQTVKLAGLRDEFGITRDKVHDLRDDLPQLVAAFHAGTLSVDELGQALLNLTSKPTQKELGLKEDLANLKAQFADVDNALANSTSADKRIAALEAVVQKDKETGASAETLAKDQAELDHQLSNPAAANSQGVALADLRGSLERQITTVQASLAVEQTHRESMGATGQAAVALKDGTAVSLDQLQKAWDAYATGATGSLKGVADAAGPAGKQTSDDYSKALTGGLSDLNTTLKQLPAELAKALTDPASFAASGTTDGDAWGKAFTGQIRAAMGQVAGIVQAGRAGGVSTDSQVAAARAAAGIGPGGGGTGPGGWQVPGPGEISNRFGENNEKGNDFSPPVGTPLTTGISGTITSIQAPSAEQAAQGLGYWVTIDAGNGLQEVIGHLDTVVVALGQAVGVGQQIGTSGGDFQPGHENPAISTGPHYEVRVLINGELVDPQTVIGKVLGGAPGASTDGGTVNVATNVAASPSGGVMPALSPIGGTAPSGGVLPALSEIGGTAPSGGVLPAGTPLSADGSVPAQIAQWIARYGAQHGWSPAQIKAMQLAEGGVSYAESNFNASSVNEIGATGPFQLLGDLKAQAGAGATDVGTSLNVLAGTGRIDRGAAAVMAYLQAHPGDYAGAAAVLENIQEIPGEAATAAALAQGRFASGVQGISPYVGGAAAVTPGTLAQATPGAAGDVLPLPALDQNDDPEKRKAQGLRDVADAQTALNKTQAQSLELGKEAGKQAPVVTQAQLDGLHAVTEGLRGVALGEQADADAANAAYQAAVAAYDGTSKDSAKASQDQIDAAKATYDQKQKLADAGTSQFKTALGQETSGIAELQAHQLAAAQAQRQFSQEAVANLDAVIAAQNRLNSLVGADKPRQGNVSPGMEASDLGAYGQALVGVRTAADGVTTAENNLTSAQGHLRDAQVAGDTVGTNFWRDQVAGATQAATGANAALTAATNFAQKMQTQYQADLTADRSREQQRLSQSDSMDDQIYEHRRATNNAIAGLQVQLNSSTDATERANLQARINLYQQDEDAYASTMRAAEAEAQATLARIQSDYASHELRIQQLRAMEAADPTLTTIVEQMIKYETGEEDADTHKTNVVLQNLKRISDAQNDAHQQQLARLEAEQKKAAQPQQISGAGASGTTDKLPILGGFEGQHGGGGQNMQIGDSAAQAGGWAGQTIFAYGYDQAFYQTALARQGQTEAQQANLKRAGFSDQQINDDAAKLIAAQYGGSFLEVVRRLQEHFTGTGAAGGTPAPALKPLDPIYQQEFADLRRIADPTTRERGIASLEAALTKFGYDLSKNTDTVANTSPSNLANQFADAFWSRGQSQTQQITILLDGREIGRSVHTGLFQDVQLRGGSA